MNAITRFLLCSLASSLIATGIVAAQGTRAGVAALPRRAQLTVGRSALQGTLPVRLRCEWGGLLLTTKEGRTPVNLSGFLGPRVGADYAMYSQPFTVGDGGGVLGFYTTGAVEIRRDALDERLGAVGGDIVVGQMIDLIDADSGELLRGIRGTFLRFTGTTSSPDSSWSYRLRVDLSGFTGRRVQLRSIVSVSPGSEPCESCPGNPLPNYITYYSETGATAPTVAMEGHDHARTPAPTVTTTEPVTTGDGVRPILK